MNYINFKQPSPEVSLRFIAAGKEFKRRMLALPHTWDTLKRHEEILKHVVQEYAPRTKDEIIDEFSRDTLMMYDNFECEAGNVCAYDLLKKAIIWRLERFLRTTVFNEISNEIEFEIIDSVRKADENDER